MKRFRIIGLALLALFALGAIAASAASAEEGVLPFAANAVTLKSGEAILETLTVGEKIECKEVKGKGEFTTNQKGKGTLDFEGCKTNGLAVNSLGDEPELILVPVEFLICLVNSSTLLFGVLIEAEREKGGEEKTVHLEVPLVLQLILVKGAVIAHNLSGNGPRKEFLLDLVGKTGEQTQALSCTILGKEFKHTLLARNDAKGKLDEHASENVVNPVMTFAKETTLMDT